MNLEEAIEALAEGTLLSTMPGEMARALVHSASVRSVGAGTPVARQGQAADRLVIPVDGALRLTFKGPDGTVTSIGQLSPRRSLNLAQVLRDGAWEYTATTETKLTVFEVAADTFRGLVEGSPEFRLYLDRITSRRSLRSAVGLLRREGVQQETLERVVRGLTEQPHEVSDTALPLDDIGWMIVDEGSFAVLMQEGAQQHQLTLLETGDFYGGGAALRNTQPLELRCARAGTLFVLSVEQLRELCAADRAFERAIRKEHPEVIKRLRASLVEIGVEYTKLVDMRAMPGFEAFESVVTAPGAGPALPALLGRPWVPPPSSLRLTEGFRCTTEEDSAAAALGSLFRFHDRTVSLSDIRHSLRRQPASLLDLAEIAERQGFVTHPGKVASPRKLGALELPVITVVDRRFVVIHEVHRRKVRLFDPMLGPRELTWSELEQHWDGIVLVLRDARAFLDAVAPREAADGTEKEAPASSAAATPSGRRARAWAARFIYLRLVADSRGLLFQAGLLTLALLLLGAILPRLSGLVVDDVLVHSDLGLLGVIAAGLILVNLSMFLLSGLRNICIAYLAGVIDHRLSSLALRHTLGVQAEAHGEDKVGTVLSRLAELERIRDSISTDIVTILIQLGQGAVNLGLVFAYSAKLGFIALVAFPLAYAVIRVSGTRYRALYTKLFDQTARMKSQTTEQVESIGTIKALNGGAAAQRRWEGTLVAGIDIERSLLKVQLGAMSGLNVLQEAARLGGLYVAVTLVLSGELSAGAVLAVSMYLSGALQPLIGLAAKLDELEQMGISFQKLDELFRLPLEHDEAGPVRAEPSFDGALKVRDVSFGYDPEGPLILRDVSFDAGQGQTIAIVGRSGSGKTTLAKLLQGGLRPTAGEILFDDAESRSLSLSTLRRNVGIVMQDSHLFAGTILENIAYGDDRPDEARAREAARLAAAQDFIAKMPNGYQTYLAEGGLGLSGGQKQRISIARALYRDPRILIMDEATSALDAESERAIMANMRDILKGRTAIVIAHRLHTVKHADQIIVIDGGRIVERGTHNELIAQRGLYHALFGQQFNQS